MWGMVPGPDAGGRWGRTVRCAGAVRRGGGRGPCGTRCPPMAKGTAVTAVFPNTGLPQTPAQPKTSDNAFKHTASPTDTSRSRFLVSDSAHPHDVLLSHRLVGQP